MEIQGKSFLITGGASGLGEGTAKLLVESGANVTLLDLQADKGEALAGELGSQARYAKTNVTSEEDVQHAVDVALEAFGGLHGVVNCAGIGFASRTYGKNGVHPLDAFSKVIEVNLIGTFNVIRLAVGAIVKEEPQASGERGVIVNTASAAAFEGQIGQAAYSASKAGVCGMTLPIARDLARNGIRVVTIAPGLFFTPMASGGGAIDKDFPVPLLKQVPFPQRWGEPSEYAGLVKHIIENGMLNGEVIRLDGAMRMAPT